MSRFKVKAGVWKTWGVALALSLVSVACTGCDDGETKTPVMTTPDTPIPGAEDASWETLRSELKRDTAPEVSADDMAALAQGNHELTLALYKNTIDGDANQMISGFSVRQAFGMLYAGARGDTESEIANVMSFAADQNAFHKAYNALDLALASRNDPGAPAAGPEQPAVEPIQLYNGNRLWMRNDMQVKDTYLDLLAVNYGAGVERLDFQGAPEPSRSVINGWVEDKTNDRIKNLLPAGSVDPDTTAVLTNAVYFKAPWQTKFEESSTFPEAFTTLAGVTKDVDTMHGGFFGIAHAQGAGWQAVELPYRKGELAMMVILPDAGTFEAFESALTAAQLSGIAGQLAPSSVRLSLPKWTFETSVDLKTPMQNMGMNTIFNAADLSGMMDGDFAVTGVFHKTFVAVDEGGTEAAAATAITIGVTSAPTFEHQFKADRPFFFVIRDVQTDAWLFFGRVTDPS